MRIARPVLAAPACKLDGRRHYAAARILWMRGVQSDDRREFTPFDSSFASLANFVSDDHPHIFA